jgi:iron complex transport system permease protein
MSVMAKTAQREDAAHSKRILLAALGILCLALFVVDLAAGSVRIPALRIPAILFGGDDNPAWVAIVRIFRLPKAITALVGGASLAVSGLMLQTLFRNPLAGPDSLGIGAGASVGAGLVVILAGGAGSAFLGELGLAGYSALALASALGAILVLLVILAISRRLAGTASLLITGILVGYFAGSVLALMVFFASPQKVQVYLGWTYGSFSGVTMGRIPVLIGGCLIGFIALGASPKAFDALVLGDRGAESVGIDVRRLRRRIIVASAILAGVVTAFCGPIAFLGIAAPQGARRLFRSSAHRILLPGSALLGAFFALLADILSQAAPGGIALPLNPLLALLGAPLILSIVLRSRSSEGRS